MKPLFDMGKLTYCVYAIKTFYENYYIYSFEKLKIWKRNNNKIANFFFHKNSEFVYINNVHTVHTINIKTL